MIEISKMAVLFTLVFCSVFLLLSAFMGAGRELRRVSSYTNTHEKVKEKASTPDELLAKMRHDRGLSKDGYLNNLNYNIGRLVMQSGLQIRAYMVYIAMVVLATIIGAGTMYLKSSVPFALAGFLAGAAFPLFALRFVIKRRQKKASSQLPDSLDVIIRSLKAGHPVPVAMSIVGREMPDPIGSEFGMASDELGFGGTVSNAVQRMADRIGHEDFDLFAAMIRLQEKTGGNLAELLEGNAATIRSRQRLRLKIRASSAEGRMSALILNAAPVGLFLIIRALAPDFFNDVADNPAMNYVFIGVVIWMAIGNLVIRKMINFEV